MRSSRNSCIKKRGTDCAKTFDPKCHSSHRQNTLYIVGTGPGSYEHLSKRATDVLESVDTVAGYTTYIELIRPFLKDKNIISTQMTKEVKRVRAAIDVALTGRSCAIVSSGDPGIYAMAGLVFEICKKENIRVIPPPSETALNEKSALIVEVVPGIPALCAGASLLGAPLSHDFASISLSDLLTPWELIEKRIEAAASADFVIVLYNPKSKRRSRQLETAQKIILKYRDKKTPAGIVVSAMRKDEMVTIIPLEDLHKADVNMQTIIFIGNSTSFTYLDFMITPRGYKT
ncbi:MAG: precorrin-3B C(17)-methyltransferase [Deltaproteobacteria bacterium]|nr:precorrin-3B C(17)-methyltransferase [Deltaproteobacteria bacterium]MBW1833461.1 precorrin-3B C(17)-methyltransferase [Deltaproteobacteria bacterium]MBW2164887.1 precorrin-3B C(17)-methyltransferase [Deltaproteobacteria bacterium]